MTKSRHRKSRWQDPILVPGDVQQIQHKFHPLYGFGFDGIRDQPAQVACLDSQVIAYGLGGNVVFHSTANDKEMKFFSSGVTVEAILWVEASPGGSLLAACERLKTGLCQISVIDVKKLEAINTFPAYGHGVYGACAFSDNERHFLAACNIEHTAQLDFWDVRDGRVLLSTTVPYEITRISFNPANNEEFAVSGPSHFKFWIIKEGNKKEINVQGLYDQKEKTKQEPTLTYTDHSWLVETSIALSSTNGRIFIIRNYAVQHILTDTGNTLCLLHTHRGFLAGKQEGTLCEYIGFDLYKVKVAEKEQRNPYAEVRPVNLLSGLAPIASMVMPPGGEQIIYLVEGDRVLKVHLGIGDDEDALLGADSARIARLPIFRMGKISSIDICPQRMLLVTCGADCLIRVWSYQRMLCEVCHNCDEEPSLVTISPWGHYLFVALARKIQIFRIVGYKLQHCKDIGGVKHIKQLRYSPGGHMVAAANSREILIICAFTWKTKAILKGHTGPVTAIAWSPDSMYLASAGLDGAIYGWFLDGYHRYLEYVAKGSVYSCLLFDAQRTFILACGQNLPLQVIDTDKKLGISHGKEFSVIGEELLGIQSDGRESSEESTSSSTVTPSILNVSPNPTPASVSPTSDDPVNQASVNRQEGIQGAQSSPAPSLAPPPASPSAAAISASGPPSISPPKKRDSTVGTEENPEGSWVQHKYRSNCMFELKNEKPVTLVAGMFKAGVLLAVAPGGELRVYTYPFSRDAPNLLKEVVLLPTGDITGLCIDEERRLIFACTTQGSIFVCTIDIEIIGPKVEIDPFEDEATTVMEVVPVIPGIMQFLQDTGTDASNILLERDEVEEMKRDLQELKLTMTREVKDASFRAQRAALEWSADMKEREAGYLERAKEYEVKVKLLSHNLHVAVNEKETAIQELLDAQRNTIQQLEIFYQNKIAQELERSHISRKHFQKDLANLEKEMKDKEQLYLEKMVLLERELAEADFHAQEAMQKVRDECNKINEHYKMEMEEDLLISDEELNKAMEKLNTDVNIEKARANSLYDQLLLAKRHVMKVEEKLKHLQSVHSDHLEVIDKLTKENAELKKTVMELDYEKRILKKVVLITDEKTQHLVHERKDQETKTIVRDFKIQQMRKREQPLEREVAQLRSQLREMEKHQLSHVMEMKRQTLIVDNLRARIAVIEEDAQKVADQLRDKEYYVDMLTRALCELVQEHDVSEWPQLIKQLYFNYVKDVHRMNTLEHLEAIAQVMYQRANLEKFVAILQREISRSEKRNWRETQMSMQQNLDMLHEFNDSQRNVKRLAFMTQKLQGDVTYWRARASNPERRLSTAEGVIPTKTTPRMETRTSYSRCSKSTRKSTPSKVRASQVSSVELSRASSPGMEEEAPLPNEEEQVKEMFRSSTPVTHILKPYLHRGTIASAASQRFSFTQNRPWSPEPQGYKDRAMIVDLNIRLSEMAKELRRKDEIIENLKSDSRLSSTYNYLPPARSQSLSQQGIQSPGRQFSLLFRDPEFEADDPALRRPRSVPTFRSTDLRAFRGKPGVESDMSSSYHGQEGDALSRDRFGTESWVPRTAESLDNELSADRARAQHQGLAQDATPPTPTPARRPSSAGFPHAARRASVASPLAAVLIDGSSTGPEKQPSPHSPTRKSSSPPGMHHPGSVTFEEPLQEERSPKAGFLRRASSPLARVSEPLYAPEADRARRGSSPPGLGGGAAHPRVLSIQLEESSLAAEKLTGVIEAFPPSAVRRKSSLAPSPVDPGNDSGTSPPNRRRRSSLSPSPSQSPSQSPSVSRPPAGDGGLSPSPLELSPSGRRSSLSPFTNDPSSPSGRTPSPLTAAGPGATARPKLPSPFQDWSPVLKPEDSSGSPMTDLATEGRTPSPVDSKLGPPSSAVPASGLQPSSSQPLSNEVSDSTIVIPRRKSSLTISSISPTPEGPPSGKRAEPMPRRKSQFARTDGTPNSRTESSGAASASAGTVLSRRKSVTSDALPSSRRSKSRKGSDPPTPSPTPPPPPSQ